MNLCVAQGNYGFPNAAFLKLHGFFFVGFFFFLPLTKFFSFCLKSKNIFILFALLAEHCIIGLLSHLFSFFILLLFSAKQKAVIGKRQ